MRYQENDEADWLKQCRLEVKYMLELYKKRERADRQIGTDWRRVKDMLGLFTLMRRTVVRECCIVGITLVLYLKRFYYPRRP